MKKSEEREVETEKKQGQIHDHKMRLTGAVRQMGADSLLKNTYSFAALPRMSGHQSFFMRY